MKNAEEFKREDQATENANGWTDTIRQLVAALECDFDRLEELREERADLVTESERATSGDSEDERNARGRLDQWDAENGEELRELIEAATVDGDEMKDADAVRERIQESPLSVQVRGGWRTPGPASAADDEEFEILLTTGGPALRIMGELDEHHRPRRAWLERQDWGTPWTHHYVKDFGDTLLTFCQQFYFGD